MSNQQLKKNQVIEENSLSRQTSGDKIQVMWNENTDEDHMIQTRKRLKSTTKREATLTREINSEFSELLDDNSIDDTIAPQDNSSVLASSQGNYYEEVDSHYTHIDDDLPVDIVIENKNLRPNLAKLTEDKMVQVPEDTNEVISGKKFNIHPRVVFPTSGNQMTSLELVPINTEKPEAFPTIMQDPNEEIEKDCCKTYIDSCWITFTCGIPILMKKKRAKDDNTVNIQSPEKPININIDTFKKKPNKLCFSSFLNVFLLTITCGIYGLIKDRHNRPIKLEPASIPNDISPLIDNPVQPALDCRRITDTLCLIGTCGLSKYLKKPSKEPEPEEHQVTVIDDVIPPIVITEDESKIPIVSFSEDQKQVLEEIAPAVITCIASYDPDNDMPKKSVNSCWTSCMDACCQTCSCGDPTSLFSRGSSAKTPHMKKEERLTPTLHKARDEGMKIFGKIIFPLVLDVAREVWVGLELATTLMGLILSVATVSFNQNEVFNILHMILIITMSILAILDATSALIKCRSCRSCYAIIKGRNQNDKEPKTKPTTKPCLRCMLWCNEKLDTVRMILAEVLLYPLLVCDIFEVIVGRGHESSSHSDRLGFALFLLSCIAIFLYVYVVRLLVLSRSIRRLKDIRTLKFRSNEHSDEVGYLAINDGFQYQVCFFIHTVLQMLAQIMMLIAIGGKIRYDNRHFYEPENKDESIHYSGYLIVMLVIGYITPTLGHLSFFIATKSWAEEFPIGIFNDLTTQLKLLKTGCFEDFFSKTDELNDKTDKNLEEGFNGKSFQNMDRKEKNERINQYLMKFKEDFKKFRSTTLSQKLEYPFRNPAIVVFSLLYAAMQLTFIVCAGVAVNEMGVVVSQVLNGGGWVAYYIFAVILGAIANAYIFIVAAFWILIVAAVIAIIAGIVLCILLVILAVMCAAGNSNSRRPQY